MPPLGLVSRPHSLRRWLASTPRRTFVLYPILVYLLQLAMHGANFSFQWTGLILLAWGYCQYRWSGIYRTRHGGGGPGIDHPPKQIVDTGIYAYMRNPMYVGHLIFMAGLAVTFTSPWGVALLLFHAWWFHQRIVNDENHMYQVFGESFANYTRHVRRWGVF